MLDLVVPGSGLPPLHRTEHRRQVRLKGLDLESNVETNALDIQVSDFSVEGHDNNMIACSGFKTENAIPVGFNFLYHSTPYVVSTSTVDEIEHVKGRR